MNPIPDHLTYGLSIWFVGFNPSLRSGETGHHYANPSNRFWKVIYEAGLTPRLYKPEEDSKLLQLGYGLTNIVARPTRTAAEITKEEYDEGRLRLMEKIKQYQPKAMCFVGIGVYKQFSGRKDIEWGEQPEPVVKGTIEYVVPSTSGLVRMRTDEIADLFRGLTKYAQSSKGGNAT